MATSSKDKSQPAATDLTCWRLSVSKGRQTWSYTDPDQTVVREANFIERHFLGLDKVR